MYRAPLVLAIICLAATLCLGLLHRATQERIAAVQARARLQAFYTLLMRHTATEPLPPPAEALLLKVIERGRKVEDSDDGVVEALYIVPQTLLQSTGALAQSAGMLEREGALTILALQGRGYGGPLRLYTAYRDDESLYHAVLLTSDETPGLGKRAEDPAYMQMFWDLGGTDTKSALPRSKWALKSSAPDSGALDAVSGSTITFNGIVHALQAGKNYLKRKQSALVY